MNKRYPFCFISAGLISLTLTLLCGLIAGFQYIIPGFIKTVLPFHAVRPLHTLFAVGWIVLTATGSIYYYLGINEQHQKRTAVHFWIFFVFRNGNCHFLPVFKFCRKGISRISRFFFFSCGFRLDIIRNQLFQNTITFF